jgi:hypothetical protein
MSCYPGIEKQGSTRGTGGNGTRLLSLQAATGIFTFSTPGSTQQVIGMSVTATETCLNTSLLMLQVMFLLLARSCHSR